MDELQSGLIPKIPGAIPHRAPTMSELVQLKILCQDAKERLGSVFADLQTLNLGENFEGADEIIDDAGRLIDSIQAFCQRSLKRMDEKKAGRQ